MPLPFGGVGAETGFWPLLPNFPVPLLLSAIFNSLLSIDCECLHAETSWAGEAHPVTYELVPLCLLNVNRTQSRTCAHSGSSFTVQRMPLHAFGSEGIRCAHDGYRWRHALVSQWSARLLCTSARAPAIAPARSRPCSAPRVGARCEGLVTQRVGRTKV